MRATSVLLLLLLLVVARSGVQGSKWYRPSECTTECDEDHQCLSSECQEGWDECEDGWEETGREALPDTDDCYDNGCDWGGCDKPGFVEVSKKPCVNLKQMCVGCMQETCCRVRDRVTCCKRLDCTEDLANCRVPQQRALGPNNSSRSDIYYTTIGHGGTATFPFYAKSTVPSNSTCDSVRMWGACTCQDGQTQPGCAFTDSSTWYDMDKIDTNTRLPPRLSLTCMKIPPPVPPAPPGEPPTTADQAGQPGRQDHGQRMSGGKIAGVVVVAVLGSVLLIGAAFSAFKMLRNEGVFPLRRRTDSTYGGVGGGGSGAGLPTGGSAYSPVFTGQSYTPGLIKPKLTLPPQLTRIVNYWRSQLSRLRGDVPDAEVVAYQQHRAALGARLASKYPSTGPALPEDIEDEELYTLEDIDTVDTHTANRHNRHQELEMGYVSDPLLSPRDSYPGHGPYVSSPHTHTAHTEPQVIHTTAVYLGNTQPLQAAGVSEALRTGHQPLTPQPTGPPPARYQPNRTG